MLSMKPAVMSVSVGPGTNATKIFRGQVLFGLLQYGGDFVDGAIGDMLDVLDLKEISRLGWHCASPEIFGWRRFKDASAHAYRCR
jgi:hypothetical protein